ncbi:toprim domain-containing protein [Sphingobacterium sp. DR205]|uniref:toprim domain-containing protein n=1 Tax=Sphingobacterium sp. DR205 TaxID=2713573 RepID=UPI0013E4601C|nr:toprim domain-containing protein [Sphingobacterium sp. DR205]QIH35890.1 toprim domain-containing protein [Sphingobacterium sp. DR205]
MSNYILRQDLEGRSIVDFLGRLGYFPVKKSGREFFYHSMLRETGKNTPSLAVWDEGGKWMDHGGSNQTGIQGGGIVQLARAYWPNHSYFEVLQKIQFTFDHFQKAEIPLVDSFKSTNKEIDSILEFSHSQQLGRNYVLSSYLQNRGVESVASGLLWEVYYRNKAFENPSQLFYALGWRNEKGNWEISSPKGFKASIGNKDISIIRGTADHLVLFEGYFDFLSWLKFKKKEISPTIIVLNSVSLVNRAIEAMREFNKIDLYLDNDEVGKHFTTLIKESYPFANDRSNIYTGFKDYNEMLMHLLRNGYSRINR